MNDDNMLRIRVTIRAMKGIAEAFESLSDDLLEKNPRLFAVLAESPLEDLDRMRKEVEERIEELKQIPLATPTS